MTEAEIRIPRPAPAERARWSAAEAIAYLIKGVPLPWKEWMGAGATAAEIEQAEIDLGRVISEGVPAWGWHPIEETRKQIPPDDLRDERIKNKAIPVSVARQPKVVVDCGGCVTTAPRQRSADYRGTRWEKVEVDAAALRRACLPPPKPKRAKAAATRGKRDPVIERMKAFYPLDGIRPKSVSIAALTRRINKLSEFKENPVSNDTVERADKEIKAARKK